MSDDTWIVSLQQILAWHKTTEHKKIKNLWNFKEFKTQPKYIAPCTIKGLDANDEDLKGTKEKKATDLRLAAIFPNNKQLVWGQTIGLIVLYIVCIIWSKYKDAHK